MAKLAKYNIAFKGLAPGVHEFNYLIDKDFFKYFDGGIASDGQVAVKVRLEKESAVMVLRFLVGGTVSVPCDRCLEFYDQPVESTNEIFVRIGEKTSDEGDDILWIGVNDWQVNVAKLIYDYIMLSIPIRTVHPDDREGNSTCNPDMMRKLKSLTTQDVHPAETDPRWKGLGKLLENK